MSSSGTFVCLLKCWTLGCLLVLFTSFVWPTRAAFAQAPSKNTVDVKRIAWVIGNGAYGGDDRLRNPVPDADMIATALKTLGFKVTYDTNLSQSQIKDRLNDFANSAAGSDIALVFYAGHGLAVNGFNYLIGVDQRPSGLSSEVLQRSGMSLAAIEARLQSVNVKTLAIVADACRQSPVRGAAPVVFTKPNVSRSVVYFFSTLPGGLARDGSGENSPFARAFHEGLKRYPHSLQKVIEYTQADVDASTGGTQIPWVGNGMVGDVSLVSADRLKLSTSSQATQDLASRRRDGLSATDSASTPNKDGYWSYYINTIEQQVHYLSKVSGVAQVAGLDQRAQGGDTIAMAALAYMYLGDLNKTIRRQGLPLGGPVPVMDLIYNPARPMERQSDPVKPSIAKALKYAEQCSTKGNVICQTLVGEMYVTGTGVTNKITSGRALLKKSAEAGHVRAQQDLIWLQAKDGAIDPNALFSGVMNAFAQHKANFDAAQEPMKP